MHCAESRVWFDGYVFEQGGAVKVCPFSMPLLALHREGASILQQDFECNCLPDESAMEGKPNPATTEDDILSSSLAHLILTLQQRPIDGADAESYEKRISCMTVWKQLGASQISNIIGEPTLMQQLLVDALCCWGPPKLISSGDLLVCISHANAPFGARFKLLLLFFCLVRNPPLSLTARLSFQKLHTADMSAV